METLVSKKKQTKPAGLKAGILIVDDHPIIRHGLSQIITQESDMTVTGYAQDAAEAMQSIKTLKPALAVVDISLNGKNGLELIKDIKIQHPNLPVLTLSIHDESLYAERALRAGAKGYIMKQEAAEKLVSAIRKVLSGQIYVSDKMAAKMMRKLVNGRNEPGASPVDSLSDRELEVFRLIGQGLGTRQIAQQLFLSMKTIETYRAHIKEKLNFADAAELLQYAIQWVNA
jgi:DNA-binding NarL/FixJ family response regulator